MDCRERQRIRRARAAEYAELYRAGQTLEEIGGQYGVTRERIRQLLAEIGVRGTDGGRAKRGADNRRAREDERDARYVAKYGMTYREVQKLRAGGFKKSAVTKYIYQRRNSYKRGIAWELTLAEWWRIWERSGKWHLRGRGHGYVMARYGDTGPYSVDNVYICTNSDNVKDYYEHKRLREQVAA